MLGVGIETWIRKGSSSAGAHQLWAWMDHPLEPGQLNKPHNLSEPQFPGLKNGRKKQYIPDHEGWMRWGMCVKHSDSQHDDSDRDRKDGDDQVPSLLDGWLFNGWKREGSSPGHQSGCVRPLLQSLQGSHLRGLTRDFVFTQAMYVERLAMRCPPCGDSVLKSALAWGGGVHPSPDSTGKAPISSSVLQPEMTRTILLAIP